VAITRAKNEMLNVVATYHRDSQRLHKQENAAAISGRLGTPHSPAMPAGECRADAHSILRCRVSYRRWTRCWHVSDLMHRSAISAYRRRVEVHGAVKSTQL